MTSGMNYNQKDIVLFPFPFSDLSGTKKRPALVLSNNSFNKKQEDLICCLITTNLEPDSDSVIVDPRDLENGKISFTSKIKPYRLFSVQKKIVERKLASLNNVKFKETIQKLHNIMA